MDKKIKNFYDLEAWQKAHELTLEIYKTTAGFPKEELFGLTSQLRRAASSVTANIAEGFGRYHFNDKIKFYIQARGSIVEVQSFLILSKDLSYIDLNQCKESGKKSKEVEKLINGLVRSLEKQK